MPQQLPMALQGLMAGGQQQQTQPQQDPDTDPNNADYEPPENGPFRCDNCTYYTDPNQCTEKHVVQGPQQGVVDPAGCCKFFNTLTPAQGDQNIKQYGK